jgi:hypothetical protein
MDRTAKHARRSAPRLVFGSVLTLLAAACGSSGMPTSTTAAISTPTSTPNLTLPAPTPAPAPVQHYSLVGFIRDKTTGNGIGGAMIQVQSGPDSGKATHADSNGYYSFGTLQSGTITVEAGGAGYLFATHSMWLNGNMESDFALIAMPPGAAQ